MAFLQIVDADGNPGRRLEIVEDQVTIGRSSTNTFCIDDPAVSSRHCVIRREGRRFTLADLHSTNGTLLNGEPVQEARLKPKDIITVGSVDILFDGPDVETEMPVASSLASGPATAAKPPATVRAEVPPAFDVRRSRRGLWIALAVVVVAALAYLGYRFTLSLMGS